MTHAEPPETGHHDDYESEDLGAGEDVLYSGCPFDIVAINDGQQTCKCNRTMELLLCSLHSCVACVKTI